MRVLVCGDRHMKMNHANIKWVEDVLFHKYHLDDDDLVIQGECEGADRIAKHVCLMRGTPMCGFPAPWDYYGKSAGAIRNRWMKKFAKPELVIAFHKDLSRSKGTADMIKIAQGAGIDVDIIS